MILGYNINPYFIKALNTPEEIEMLKNLPDANNERFQEFNGNFDFLEEITGIDIDDNNTVLFTDELNLRKFLRYAELAGYNYKVLRADKMLFKNKFDFSIAEQKLKTMVKEFILKNFNINDVLDKMNEGLKLTEYDYQILNSH